MDSTNTNAQLGESSLEDLILRCKICGSSRLSFFAHTAKCADCKVLLYWPYPAIDKENPSNLSTNKEWYYLTAPLNHRKFAAMVSFATEGLSSRAPYDLLDYGGGGGQFALTAKSLFPNSTVYHTDINDNALLDVWKPMNVLIRFEAFDRNDQLFDVIFLNDVFEHVSDPADVLARLKMKLKPEGRIFLDTPRQFWLYSFSRLIPSLHRKILSGTVSLMHLQIWSRKSLYTVIERAGLRIERETTWAEFTMPADTYMRNMGITSALLLYSGRAVYNLASLILRNKFVMVLKQDLPSNHA